VGLSGGIPTTACSLRGNTDTQAAQVVVPSPASCVQSCSSVQITRLCVSPNISRGCCVLPQDLGQDIHHNRSTRDGFHSRLHFGSSITGVGRSHLVGTPTCGGLTFSDAQNLPLGSRSVDPSFNSSWVSRLGLTVRVACSTPVLNHTQRSCVANPHSVACATTTKICSVEPQPLNEAYDCWQDQPASTEFQLWPRSPLGLPTGGCLVCQLVAVSLLWVSLLESWHCSLVGGQATAHIRNQASASWGGEHQPAQTQAPGRVLGSLVPTSHCNYGLPLQYRQHQGCSGRCRYAQSNPGCPEVFGSSVPTFRGCQPHVGPSSNDRTVALPRSGCGDGVRYRIARKKVHSYRKPIIGFRTHPCPYIIACTVFRSVLPTEPNLFVQHEFGPTHGLPAHVGPSSNDRTVALPRSGCGDGVRYRIARKKVHSYRKPIIGFRTHPCPYIIACTVFRSVLPTEPNLFVQWGKSISTNLAQFDLAIFSGDGLGRILLLSILAQRLPPTGSTRYNNQAFTVWVSPWSVWCHTEATVEERSPKDTQCPPKFLLSWIGELHRARF
jgi:hypothetical protein